MNKKTLFLWLFTIVTLSSFATEYTISSVNEFKNLNLSAGDTVTWLNGTYSSDERITFSGLGTASNPITLKSETPGGVIFDNGLQMDIAGNYLVVDGFYWNGGYGASNFIQFRNGTTYATYSTIKNCAINGLTAEPGDAAEAAADGAIIKHRWIVLYGNHNNVTNCTFMNKNTAGALVLAEYEYNAAENRCAAVEHTITNNYFFNFEKMDSSLSNAGDSETIRIGTSEFQNVNSAATISGNYFVQADGENEIITNKSANNNYFNNTFRRCKGSLVMRHGANATVNGNYFLGENVEGTGGIRIADSDHTITNNYIQNCVTATNFAAWNNGLTFVGGNTSSVPNCTTTSVSNAYQDVDNITFSNNTFVNTNSPIYFNASRDGADNVFGTVADNVIYFDSGNQNISDIISGSYSEIGNTLTFSGNLYEGTTTGESVSGFSSVNLTATNNGEIYSISGTSGAGASIPSSPLTDNDVSSTVGACFLDANGSSLTGCDDSTPINSLNVSNLNTFEASESSQTISVTSNLNWSVSENSNWITVNTTSGSNNGSVIVTTTENTTTTDRTATITISGSGISKTISVSQTGTEDDTVIPESCTEGTNLSLNGTIVDFSTEQNTTNTVTNILSENGRWSAETFPQYATIDLGDDYSVNQVNLATLFNRDYQFIVDGSTTSANSGFSTLVDASNNTSAGTITENFSAQKVRYVRLTITGANSYTGTWASITEFQVICAGEDTITPPEDLNITTINDFDASASSQTVTVSSNINWTVSENSSWISINNTSGSNDGSFTITTTENTSTTDRTATVTIAGGDISREITVSQDGAEDIITPPEDLNITTVNDFNASANSQTVTVSSNVNWTVSENSSWISINNTSGSNDGSFTITTTENTSTTDRTATVTIAGGDISREITVSQDGAEVIVVPPTESCTEGTNLSLNSTIVDFSTEQNTTNTVTNILSENGRWSAQTFPQYATIDLGNDYSVNQVNLATLLNRDYQFIVDGSTTSATSGFSTLVDASNNTSAGTITETFSAQTVRYVRLTITGANSYTGAWASITEFQIICAGGDTITPPEDLNVTTINDFDASASSQTVTVSSNVDWTVSENSSWISVNNTSGSNNGSFNITTTENTSTNNRKAIITVEGTDVSREITVSQDGAEDIVIPPTDSCSNGTNLSLNGTIVDFSTEQNTTNTVNNLIDNSTSNRWSAEGFPQYATVDLGDNYSVGEVNLTTLQNRDYQFTVEGSTTSATSGFSTLINASGTTTETFPAQTVRYVKLTITGANSYTGTWSSISQFKIICAGGEEEEEENPNTDLDPNKAPSANFDLSQWYLGVPIDRGDGVSTSISVDDLNNDYELKDVDDRDYFYTGSDGAMVFRNYPKDAPKTSLDTSYSRTELREMIYGDDASTKDEENNWYFSSSDDIPSNAGGVDGTLTATLAVDRVTTTATSDVQQGRIIVGQIHASGNEPNRLYYHKLPSHNKGAIYVAHEAYDGEEVFYNIIGDYVEETGDEAGDLKDDPSSPSDGIELGEVWSYEIKVIGNDQWVTISREGKSDIETYINMSDSGYDNGDWMYFKAGVYSQNKTCQSDDDYDEVSFYALTQSHDSTTKSKGTTEVNNATVYPNPFSETLNINFGDLNSKVTSISMVDMSGRVVLNKKRNTFENTIQLNGYFSNGVYFIQLLDSNGNIVAIKKVVNN